MAEFKTVTLLASAARTSTTTGDPVSTLKGPAKVITGESDGFNGTMLVVLNVTAAAAGTLDLTIEGSIDNGTTWVTLAPASSWTQVTTTPGKQSRTYAGPIPPMIRAVGTQATTPNHTYSVTALIAA